MQLFQMPTSLLLHCCSPTPTPTQISNLCWQVFLILHPLEFRWYISFKVPFFSHHLSCSPRPFSTESEVPRLRVSSARCISYRQKHQCLLTWHATFSLLSLQCIFSHLDFFSCLRVQTQHTFAIYLPRGLLPLSKPKDVLMCRCVWHPSSLPSLFHSASTVRALQPEGCSDTSCIRLK